MQETIRPFDIDWIQFIYSQKICFFNL